MYAKTNNLNNIGVNLTYISQNDESTMKKSFSFTEEYLTSYMNDLLKKCFITLLKLKEKKEMKVQIC